MEEDSVVALPQPGSSVTDDPLLAVLREGARRMLMQAHEREVAPGPTLPSGPMQNGVFAALKHSPDTVRTRVAPGPDADRFWTARP